MYRVCIIITLLSYVNSYKIEVKVKQGRILGTRQATLFDGRLFFAFYRIPYAQAPVKTLRFKDPKPIRKWNNILDAKTEYHGACAQAHIVHKHATYGVENCLYLNVFTPALPKEDDQDKKLKPVIVWIHGYAFTSTFSHIHGADFLIENDVLLVTVSHRIGVFGFLKPEGGNDANMGLKDIVMALKWIRQNIHAFGGDKRKITVMSCSSAATFVSLLLITDASKLFSKVILQSGSIFSPSIFQGDPDVERHRLIDNLNKKNIKMNNATTKQIIMASLNIYSREEMINFQRAVVPFSPIVELKSNVSLLTRTPETFRQVLEQSNFKKPMLIGFNTQESISEVIPFIQNPLLFKSYTSLFKFMVPFSEGCNISYKSANYKIIASKIVKQYFKGRISENSINEFISYTSDLIKFPIIKFVKTLLRRNISNSMYMYKFDYKGKFNAMKATSLGNAKIKLKGAASGDEICYILKCEPLWETYAKIRNHKNNVDKAFMQQISELWSNFAKHGKPTPAIHLENTMWPKFITETQAMLFIGKTIQVIDSRYENGMYKFWDTLYENHFKHCHMHNEL